MTRPPQLELGGPASQLARHGPLVNREALVALILPTVEKIGYGAFARKAGVDPSGLQRVIHGVGDRARPRLNYADKLLTCGLGRPDLLEVVCPVERE